MLQSKLLCGLSAEYPHVHPIFYAYLLPSREQY
jgi:hypothetical protein